MKTKLILLLIAFMAFACNEPTIFVYKQKTAYTFTLKTADDKPADTGVLYYGVNKTTLVDYFDGHLGLTSGFEVAQGDSFVIKVNSSTKDFTLWVRKNDTEEERTLRLTEGSLLTIKF